jgi:hypothetical protein
MQFFLFASGIGAYLYSVWVEKVIWNWFLPEFFGLPVITFVQMGALSVLINCLRYNIKPSDLDHDNADRLKLVISGYVYFTLALGMAYLWRLAI